MYRVVQTGISGFSGFFKKSPEGWVPGGTLNLSPENINHFFELFRLIAFQNTQKFYHRASINIFLTRRKLEENWKFSEIPRLGEPFSHIRLAYTTILSMGEHPPPKKTRHFCGFFFTHLGAFLCQYI